MYAHTITDSLLAYLRAREANGPGTWHHLVAASHGIKAIRGMRRLPLISQVDRAADELVAAGLVERASDDVCAGLNPGWLRVTEAGR